MLTWSIALASLIILAALGIGSYVIQGTDRPFVSLGEAFFGMMIVLVAATLTTLSIWVFQFISDLKKKDIFPGGK